jgi:hypothetical protein
MSMRVKGPVRSKTSARGESKRTAAPAAAQEKTTGFQPGAGTFVLAVVVLFAIGMMIVAPASETRVGDTADTTVPTMTAAPAPEGKPVTDKSPKSPAMPKAHHAASSAPVSKTEKVPATAPEPTIPPTAVTVSGCVAETDGGYRLTDTTGDNAPKSRNWKMGFLKKSTAAISLINPPDPSVLRSNVGRRVSVTGVLDGREMRPLSVRRIAASCK